MLVDDVAGNIWQALPCYSRSPWPASPPTAPPECRAVHSPRQLTIIIPGRADRSPLLARSVLVNTRRILHPGLTRHPDCFLMVYLCTPVASPNLN